MSTPFSTARAEGAPRKTRACQTCGLISELTGHEAQSLQGILGDDSWSLQAVADLVYRSTGRAIDKAALYRHVRNHTAGRRRSEVPLA